MYTRSQLIYHLEGLKSRADQHVLNPGAFFPVKKLMLVTMQVIISCPIMQVGNLWFVSSNSNNLMLLIFLFLHIDL